MLEEKHLNASNVSTSLAAVSKKISGGAPLPCVPSGKPAAQSSPASKSKTTVKRKAKPTKSASVEKLLRRKSGATIGQIENATGWQPHTCRAFLTGLRKKGHEIIREKDKKGASVYRFEIATSEGAPS